MPLTPELPRSKIVSLTTLKSSFAEDIHTGDYKKDERKKKSNDNYFDDFDFNLSAPAKMPVLETKRQHVGDESPGDTSPPPLPLGYPSRSGSAERSIANLKAQRFVLPLALLPL